MPILQAPTSLRSDSRLWKSPLLCTLLTPRTDPQVRSRNDKLENHLAEAIEKLKSLHQSGATTSSLPAPAATVASNAKLEDIAAELEEQRELANNRLAELDRLHRQHRDTLKEVEKLKMDVSFTTKTFS